MTLRSPQSLGGNSAVDNGLGPDAIDVDVGHRIRVRRNMLNLPQTALAETLGVSFQQVQKYERGSNRVSASMLVKIAASLETTVAELVGEVVGKQPDSQLYEKLAAGGAVELVELYAGLKNSVHRTAILELARTLSRA